MSDMKKLILGTISDLVADFLYYDRKEDESLPMGTIEHCVADGTVSVGELVEHFRTQLLLGLGKDDDS